MFRISVILSDYENQPRSKLEHAVAILRGQEMEMESLLNKVSQCGDDDSRVTADNLRNILAVLGRTIRALEGKLSKTTAQSDEQPSQIASV